MSNELSQRVARKVKAREAAKSCVDLLSEAANSFEDESAALAFWEQIRDELGERVELVAKAPGVEPMSDAECTRFLARPPTFGKFKGLPMPPRAPYLVWLDWLVGQPDAFKDDARRCLANPKIQDELREALRDV